MSKCFFNGCDSEASDGWRCYFHRGRGRCLVDSCHNQAYARQLCARHGGKRQCRFAGCAFRSRTGAYCTKHGSTRIVSTCSRDDCSNSAQLRGLCVKHGGGRYCKMDGCRTFARTGGYCARHTRILREIVPKEATDIDLNYVHAFNHDNFSSSFVQCHSIDNDGVDVEILDIILNM
ncbi:hypothetical protein H257_12777 [Aphanomyces astaci]|uniref:WRKY19-like zinc finger domain-containing protein n=1 Tax=Aphanomyces astaci TaxID=112090 RepID=W4FY98_APHAT|nr:hypothetical protein H257_12777 [Aphanomyces astaci]ETV71946.1 hypothetical protein H257_12777 [Aphanomyces astaci]|eukprot:XP_009838389.1 hypothetical protein H257_12777 [Aphanomyces astaci]